RESRRADRIHWPASADCSQTPVADVVLSLSLHHSDCARVHSPQSCSRARRSADRVRPAIVGNVQTPPDRNESRYAATTHPARSRPTAPCKSTAQNRDGESESNPPHQPAQKADHLESP